jgi:hypothetical protein
MDNSGKMTIVVNLPLADTPDLRAKVIESLNGFVNETIIKITLDSINLE